METPASEIESLVEQAEALAQTSYELAKLRSLQTTTEVSSSLIARLSVMLMVSLTVLLLSISTALLLGDLLGKSYYGFFIVSGFYLIASIVLHFFLRKWIKNPVADAIISQALH